MFKVLLVGLCFVLQSFFVLFAQNYDDNFAKPIVTENGKFHYYELPAIKTSEGELIFLDRNLGALSDYVGTTDSWGDLYQWGRATDGHEKRSSDTILTLSDTYETGHARFIVDERKANDWLRNSDDDLWKEEKGLTNPCPCGYRIPTEKEWRALLNLGYEIKTTSEGFYYLSIAGGQLLLPAAGLRSAYTGNFLHLGTRGYYWGVNALSRGTSSCIDFNKDDITTNISIFGFRAFGRSVRCVKEH